MTTELRIYEAKQDLGVQEKYIKGLLSDKHGLTALDVQRMLEFTNCQERVCILSLSEKSIADGLTGDLEERFIYDNEDCIIPLILNYPSANGVPYWFTAQVTFHSASGEISYQVNDLPQEKHSDCKAILEGAIAKSFENKPLLREKSSIKEPSSQRAPHLSGYYALHHLFRNKEIQRGNAQALEYADTPSQPDNELIRAFFKIQLTNLRVPTDVYYTFSRTNLLQRPIVDNQEHVAIDEGQLATFLEHLQAPPVETTVTEYKAVSEAVGAYSPGTVLLSFPVGAKNETIGAIPYMQFFSELAELVLKDGIRIPVMRLSHCDQNALKGLNDFLVSSDSPSLPFKTLQINVDFSDRKQVDVFVKHLQLALKNLSLHDLAKIELIDDHQLLTQSDYDKLLEFIDKEKIAIQVDLPMNFREKDCQRQMDRITAINIRSKNNQSLQSTLNQERVETSQKKEKVVRQRGNVSFNDVTIDLEVAAAVSETVVISPTVAKPHSMQHYDNFKALTFANLQEAISNDTAGAYKDFISVSGGLSKEDLVKFWHSLSSNIQLENPSVLLRNPQFDGFTTTCFARLVQFKEYFKDGINIDQLPAGFVLIPNPRAPQTFLLHYDSASEARNTLAPRLIEKRQREKLSIDCTDSLLKNEATPESLRSLWTALQTGHYSRMNSELFRRFLPELLSLTPQQLDKLLEICNGVENFSYVKLAFIFENLDKARCSYAMPYNEKNLVSVDWMEAHFESVALREKFVTFANEVKPSEGDLHHPLFKLLQEDEIARVNQAIQNYQLTNQELNELLRLYDKYGSNGISKLLTQWAKIDALVPLKKLPTIIKNIGCYEKLLIDDELLQAVEVLSQFDSNKKQWWDRLYAVHTPQNDDFLSLYNSFTQFTQSIEQYGLTFYDLSHKKSDSLFIGAGNLPSTLGRMLSILNLCNPEDRRLQWEAMSEINLASTGALRAMTFAKAKRPSRLCGFVVPEMNFSPSNHKLDQEGLYDEVYMYDGGFDDYQAMQQFYSALAYENNRFPLAFYKEAVANLPSKELTPQARQQLCCFLFYGTVNNNYCLYSNDQEAMQQWKGILEDIKNVKSSIPLLSAEVVREEVIDNLFELIPLPSLPILGRLIKLLMEPLRNITLQNSLSILAIRDKLKENKDRLAVLLSEYNEAVYNGMIFYDSSDAQAEGETLFEHHLDVSEAIKNQKTTRPNLPAKELIEQISTFHIETGKVGDLVRAIPFFAPAKMESFRNTLSILKDIKSIIKPNGEKLNQDDLIKFIEDFSHYRDNDLLSFVEKQFGAHFDPSYFTKRKMGEPAPEIEHLITGTFIERDIQSLVTSITKQFSNESNSDQQRQLITRIQNLCTDLSYSNKLELLKFLAQPKLTEDATIATYLTLLNAINEKGTTRFRYFMQMAETFQTQQLALKATFFLEKALPQICNNDKVLSDESDLIDPVIDTVLAANKGELETAFESINPKLSSAYQHLMNSLNECKTDSIKDAIAELSQLIDVNAINGMPDFKEHLTWLLTTPEPADSVVTLEKKETKHEERRVSQFVSRAGSLLSGTIRLLGRAASLLSVKVNDEEKTITSAQIKEKRQEKELDQKKAKAVVDALKERIQALTSYDGAFAETFGLINALVEKYPGAKSQILEQCHHHLRFNETRGNQILETLDSIRTLKQAFEELNDQNLVIGLCENFDADKTDSFNYQHLLAIFKGKEPFNDYPSLKPEAKKQILGIVNSLLNNKKTCTLNDIETLVKNSSDTEKGAYFQKILGIAYANAPFPPLTKINEWFTASLSESDIQTNYSNFSKEPINREPENGFNLEKAKKQCQAIQGISFESEELTAIDECVNGKDWHGAKELDTQTILASINNMRKSKGIPSDDQIAQVVALMAELLYRTKGLEATPGQLGRSFEINTTQYLAIYSALKKGGHVTSQIGTGEGKSRIMMILIACQYALGKTVDFVTADASLAMRDYLEYQSFFKAINAETRLITGDMPASEYQQGGIHFSDPTHLSLFRNRARSEGYGDKVIDPDPTNRALMLDEADKVFFDCADRRFNYSVQADPAIRGMDWIYKALVSFFSKPENEALYKTDADACNEKFINSVSNPEEQARLRYNPKLPRPVISRNQLETWQYAALTALKLKSGAQFTLLEKVPIKTKEGQILASQAQLRTEEGRAVGHAKMSFGVHQCLHARLNMIREGLLPQDSEANKVQNGENKRLEEYEHPFSIDPETQIVYSSTSQSLLDDYNQGNLLAVTGTAGAIRERTEAQEVHNLPGNVKMSFIDIPRHNGQQRIDRPILLAAGRYDEKAMEPIVEQVRNAQMQNKRVRLNYHNEYEKAAVQRFIKKKVPNFENFSGQGEINIDVGIIPNKQMKKIRNAVLTALENEQPILLVCENDNESDALLRYLQKELTPEQSKQLKRIASNTNLSDENKYIAEHAGKPGAITVSTAMLGRGTDIKLQGKAKTHGLCVIGTYLPRERDYWQIVGRAGRFGEKGESQFILDVNRESTRIKQYLKRDEIPIEFYTATEDYFKMLQDTMDRNAQSQRLIKNLVGRFYKELTNQFFNEFKPKLFSENKNEIFSPWRVFLSKFDFLWAESFKKIQVELENKPVSEQEIDNHLLQFYQDLKSEWGAMITHFEVEVDNGKISSPEGKDHVAKTLIFPSELSLPANIKGLLATDKTRQDRLLTPIAEHYDPAYKGRAVIYKNKLDGIKAFFKNIAAALRGDAPWFPNLKAAQRGNMSWSQFFFGSWGAQLPKSSATIPVENTGSKSSTTNVLAALGMPSSSSKPDAEVNLSKERTPKTNSAPLPSGASVDEKLPENYSRRGL